MLIHVLIVVGTVLRLVLLGYGEWQDRTMAVKFTDVDYHVFQDAAEFMYQGGSPYQRDTYRYTPMLAWLLQPNVFWTPMFGKLLFILFDVLTGYLIYSIVRTRNVSQYQSLICASFWLLNPLPMTVSSRGNAESIMSFLVLMCLKLLLDMNICLAGVVYALSIHVKIYPVTYALPIYLLLGEDNHHSSNSVSNTWKTLLKSLLPNKNRIVFILSSFATLGGLTWICYYWYGFEFLHHTYLYHIVRRDIRHNFSIYFYLLYLHTGASPGLPLGLLAFVPQVVLLVAFSIRYYRDPALAFFLNTFAFVAFNKVCTSQYFLWYLCLLPLLLPNISVSMVTAMATISYWFVGQYFLWYLCLLPLLLPNISVSMVTAMATISCWFVGQGIWLLPAYYLEFLGYNTFLYIWAAGLVFFSTNIYIMYVVIGNYQQSPSELQSVKKCGTDRSRQKHDIDSIKYRLRSTENRKPKHT